MKHFVSEYIVPVLLGLALFGTLGALVTFLWPVLLGACLLVLMWLFGQLVRAGIRDAMEWWRWRG